MTFNSYPWGEVFQLRLLSALVKYPESVVHVVEPQFFTNPIHSDVARVIQEVYEKHSAKTTKLSRTTLKELVKSSLSRKERKNWALYKKAIKAIYHSHIADHDVIFQQALEFAREQKYRKALIDSEKAVSEHRYEAVHSKMDGLRCSANGHLTFENVSAFDPTRVQKTKWLVDGLIPERNISLFFGEFGSFKSFLQLYLAKVVSEHQNVFDRTTRKRRILCFDYENPPDVIRQRNEDLNLGLEGNKNFKIWDRFGNEAIPKPGDPRLQDLVKSCVEETERGPWLIFDSWASCLETGEGGETTGQTAPLYEKLRKLCDLGATVSILDHCRKYDREVIYGGSDKGAKADVIHNLVVHENKAKPNNPIVRVESFLKRHSPKGVGSLAFQVKSWQDDQGKWHVRDLVLARDPAWEEKRANIHLLKDLIRHNPDAGKRKLESMAGEKGLAMGQAAELLKSGVEKYWEKKTIAHGKSVYSNEDSPPVLDGLSNHEDSGRRLRRSRLTFGYSVGLANLKALRHGNPFRKARAASEALAESGADRWNLDQLLKGFVPGEIRPPNLLLRRLGAGNPKRLTVTCLRAQGTQNCPLFGLHLGHKTSDGRFSWTIHHRQCDRLGLS
ncbi:MAG: AAA family ATPase [Candidatus Acidiferrales bacterium]